MILAPNRDWKGAATTYPAILRPLANMPYRTVQAHGISGFYFEHVRILIATLSVPDRPCPASTAVLARGATLLLRRRPAYGSAFCQSSSVQDSRNV
jgi:hypothetical protein